MEAEGQVPESLDAASGIWPDSQEIVPGLMRLSSTDVASEARIFFQLMEIRDRNRKRGISDTILKTYQIPALAAVVG